MLGAYDATKRYVQAMAAFDGAPEIDQLSCGTPFRPPGGAGLPYVAKIPALAYMKIIMNVQPIRSGLRLPHRSMYRSAGMVIRTLMTY